jgi:signal transduction histidine kinase
MVEPTTTSSLETSRRPISPLLSLILGLLVVLGTAGFAYQTQLGVNSNRVWVLHTYEVRNQIQSLQTRFAEARGNALAYAASHDKSQLREFRARLEDIPALIASLHSLTSDNPRQQHRLTELQTVSGKYLADLGSSVDAAVQSSEQSVGKLGDAGAAIRGLDVQETQLDLLLRSMSQEEQALLDTRLSAWNRYFRRNAFFLGLAFLVALLFLSYNYRLLTREVVRTREMGQIQRESVSSSRALSTRVLELQDAERRKVARELHDSVGQYLVGLKINIEQLLSSNPNLSAAHAKMAEDTVKLTDRAISEVRTISHLLHPPLLDEVGLESAARWYADGFAKRSGLQVTCHFSDLAVRLPRDVELALFRVLQESLTNVHRHASAKSVTIELACDGSRVVLCVSDDGLGIPREILARFRSGLASGVGLAGMKQRLAELDGTLEVDATTGGTLLRATMPVSGRAPAKALQTSST